MSIYTLRDVELIHQLAALEARDNFYAFRRYIRPKLKINWFVKDCCKELQAFHDKLINNERPMLAISAPPQHGKSTLVVDFIAWLSGKYPDKRTIYTAFSDRLGIRANLTLQRIFDSSKFQKVFPEFKIASPGQDNSFGATRNRELIEFIGHEGFFRNTTVRGSITGESLDLGIVDDPIKGREAANSETIRVSTWEWMTDDFLTRFSDDAGLLMIMTRWHIDDPMSRLKAELGDQLRIVNYPAIAEQDEKYRKEGDPLFPEHKSKEFLTRIMNTMSRASAQALYQGNPLISGGGVIRTEYFRYYKVLPKLVERKIFADTAQKTKEANDFSVFECWGRGENGNIYLVDLIRGKWEAPELERKALAFWAKHKAQDSYELGNLRKLSIEDKSSGTGLIQKIRRNEDGHQLIPVEAIERQKDRYTRVTDVLGYIESGYVYLPDPSIAPWVLDFVSECEAYMADDSHMHDDQIDPMCDAISDFIASKNSLAVWEKLAS